MSIELIAYALPSIRQTYFDIAMQTGADPDFIATKVGVKERFILGPHESGISLSMDACRSLLEKAPELKGNIDLIVCVTQNPDRRLPHNAPSVAHALGLPTSIASFDISLGCSGYVYGVNIVEGFLQSCGLKNAILITCDPYSRVMSAEDKDTNCIFGDAATATWIRSKDGRSRILGSDFGTDGAASDAIEIKAGGALLPLVSLLSGFATSHYSPEDLRLQMRGRSVYNFVLSNIPKSIESCLAKTGATIDDIDYFALHQGSMYMLHALAMKVGIPEAKLLTNMNRFGNTVSSSVPLLLADLDTDKKLSSSLVLMCGFGVGLSWATSIVKF